MKKILSTLFTVFFILFFVYYLLFFRALNISFSIESNKAFFKWLFRDPLNLVVAVTPGTELHKAYLDFDPLQADSVFDTVVEETSPLSTTIIVDGTTWPEHLSFSSPYHVYDVFNSLVTSNLSLPDVQESMKEWDWINNMVSGDVVVKDSGKMMLGLNVSSPDYLESRGNPHVFKVGCTVKTSVLVSSNNLEALEYGIDFFEQVSVGDTIHSYCTSEECIGLGRGCILVKAQSE